MRVHQPWEGPTGQLAPARQRAAELAAREPIDMECNECGHEWQTRAKPSTVLRCPACQHPRRVPVPRDDDDYPAPAPRPAYRPPAPPVRRAPAPARRASPTPARPRPTPQRRPAAAPAPSGFGLAATLAAWAETAIAARRAPGPTPAAPRPASATPPAPVRAGSPLSRASLPAVPASAARRAAVRLLAALNFPMAPRVTRPGYCELASGRESRRGLDCGGDITHRVTFPGGGSVDVCEGHAYAIGRQTTLAHMQVTIALIE